MAVNTGRIVAVHAMIGGVYELSYGAASESRPAGNTATGYGNCLRAEAVGRGAIPANTPNRVLSIERKRAVSFASTGCAWQPACCISKELVCTL